MHHQLSQPELWLELYGDILFRYGYLRVHDYEIAEDLVQETLLAALKAKENYSGQASEQTWLISILKHKVIDFFRKTAREKTQQFELQGLANEEDYFNQKGHWQVDTSTWSKPDKWMEQQQFVTLLTECIERLPPRMAQLFILRELDDMKNEEICKLLSISTTNNLWVMLSRIRMQLRHCLDTKWINP